MKRDELKHLLATVRRRLWLGEIERRGITGLWWLGMACLVLGLIHRWAFAVPWPAAFAVALLPATVLAATAVAMGRPSLDYCARVADRLCDARELFSTALELEGRTVTRAGAPLVRREARAAARRMLTELPSLRRPRRGTVWPLAMATAGAFLLAGPGALTAAAISTASVQPTPMPATTPLAQRRDVAAELAAAEVRARPMTAGDAPGLPDDDDGPTPLLVPDVSRAGRAAPSDAETGKLPATARALTRPDGNVALPDLELQLVAVDAVDALAQLAGGTEGAELDPTALREPALEAGPSLRTRAAEAGGWNRFDLATRSYLAAYFAEIERRADTAAGRNEDSR